METRGDLCIAFRVTAHVKERLSAQGIGSAVMAGGGSLLNDRQHRLPCGISRG